MIPAMYRAVSATESGMCAHVCACVGVCHSPHLGPKTVILTWSTQCPRNCNGHHSRRPTHCVHPLLSYITPQCCTVPPVPKPPRRGHTSPQPNGHQPVSRLLLIQVTQTPASATCLGVGGVGVGYKATMLALVTGGNRGIGLEVVRMLLRASPAGSTIFMGCRDLAAGSAIAAELNAGAAATTTEVVAVALDVTSAGSIAASVGAVTAATTGSQPHLDLLVNNAGVMPEAEVPEYATRASCLFVVLTRLHPTRHPPPATRRALACSVTRLGALSLSVTWPSLISTCIDILRAALCAVVVLLWVRCDRNPQVLGRGLRGHHRGQLRRRRRRDRGVPADAAARRSFPGQDAVNVVWGRVCAPNCPRSFLYLLNTESYRGRRVRLVRGLSCVVALVSVPLVNCWGRGWGCARARLYCMVAPVPVP